MAVEVRRHPARYAGLPPQSAGVVAAGRQCLVTAVDCITATLPVAGIVVAVALPFAALSFAQCRVARAQSAQDRLREQIRFEQSRATRIGDDLQASLDRSALKKMAAEARMHEAGTPIFLGGQLP